MRVYLAGKMAGRMGDEVIDERERAAVACIENGLKYVDPAAGENIERGRIVDLQMTYERMKSYVEKDEYAVRNCDAVIVLTGDTPSEGTGCEIALASFLHKPVILVAPGRLEGERMGFWNVKASKIVMTVEEAAEYLAENYSLGEY